MPAHNPNYNLPCLKLFLLSIPSFSTNFIWWFLHSTRHPNPFLTSPSSPDSEKSHHYGEEENQHLLRTSYGPGATSCPSPLPPSHSHHFVIHLKLNYLWLPNHITFSYLRDCWFFAQRLPPLLLCL